MYLKQSTASQSVLIGPFVDSTDGNTAETGLTIANTDIRLSKNGANIAAKNSGGGTHDELGYYTITLDATDTNTVGRLQLMVHVAGALPVYHEFEVLEEAVYDDLFGASAVGYPTATEVWAAATRTLTANTNLNDPTAAAIADAVWDETQSTHVTAGSFGEIATEVASILADTNELQTDNVPGLIAGLNDPTAATIAAAVWDALQASHVTAGSFGEIATEIASILVDTGTTLQAELDGIQADTEDLQTQIGTAGAGLTAVPWNAAWDAEVESEVNDALDTAISELGVAAPTATPTIRTALMLLYMALRNARATTASADTITNDAGTTIATATLSDNGTTFSKGEYT